MTNRGYKKWKPFNSVVSSSDLINKKNLISFPNPSKDEILEYEELLKKSLYLKVDITIKYLEGNTIKEITDHVIKFDQLKKNIILSSKTINFRQIYNIKSAN